ncbi:transposase [Clostridium sp. C105KSO13]|uniref:transposase n=1 Tax=Clostridium sp. C105KSO13 TaxID=1776045 RepID=UPI0007408553|nr:transposase [Clostridium sp. C105KSO13]CUX18673.1 IS2 repressor TnpA [Clostridium sp. C105KSO13]
MARNQRQYDTDYKIQSVKLSKEIGLTKAAKELGISTSTLNGWVKAYKEGKLDLGLGFQTPDSAMSLTEELISLRKQLKEQNKEIKRLKEENEFLEEASAFFAASRRKSAKTND